MRMLPFVRMRTFETALETSSEGRRPKAARVETHWAPLTSAFADGAMGLDAAPANPIGVVALAPAKAAVIIETRAAGVMVAVARSSRAAATLYQADRRRPLG